MDLGSSGGGLGDACDPIWLDLLTDTLLDISTDPDIDQNWIRKQILPSIKHINANDFARACSKVHKEEGSPFVNNVNDNDDLIFTCAARLARGCSPMEKREKQPLLFLATLGIGNHSKMTPIELLSHDIPIVRAQMTRSLWEWKDVTIQPQIKDAIARRLPGLDYRSINYRLTTQSAKPKPKSMLEKLIPNIVRNIARSIDKIAALSTEAKGDASSAENLRSGSKNPMFRGWFKRFGSVTTRTQNRKKKQRSKLKREVEVKVKDKDRQLSREERTTNIIDTAKSSVEELCYSIEVSLILLTMHVPLVCRTVESMRLSTTISSCVTKQYGVMPSSLVTVGLTLLSEICHALRKRTKVNVKKILNGAAASTSDLSAQDQTEQAIEHMVNSIKHHLAPPSAPPPLQMNEEDKVEAEDEDGGKNPELATSQPEAASEPPASENSVSASDSLKEKSESMHYRELTRHRRAALNVVTASRHTGMSCVKEVCLLLLDADTSVQSTALESVRAMCDINPFVPCDVLCNMLTELRTEKDTEGAITILVAMEKLGSVAAERSSQDLIAVITEKYAEVTEAEVQVVESTQVASKKEEDDRGRNKEADLRYSALKTLISVLSDEVAIKGFEAPLISVFEMVLSQRNEHPRIRSHALLKLSSLLGPASVRFAKHFVRNLVDHDPETRRVALVSIQALGPAAKRFYAQIVARLEDDEFHLRHLAATTLASTFPPAAASRLIVRKMDDSSGGSRMKKSIREVHVDALSKLLRGTHRKYAKGKHKERTKELEKKERFSFIFNLLITYYSTRVLTVLFFDIDNFFILFYRVSSPNSRVVSRSKIVFSKKWISPNAAGCILRSKQ